MMGSLNEAVAHARGGWCKSEIARRLTAALAFLPFLSAALVVWTHGLHPPMDDFRAYWLAGQNVRLGGEIYGQVPTEIAYRYAPWFAWVWGPFTSLPEAPVRVGWYLILLAASMAVLVSMVRYGLAGWCAAGILSVFFVDGAVTGNVSPLIAAALFYTLPTRFGPFAIAATASLKAFPIVLAVVYLGRQDWRSFGITAIATIALISPMLLYDLSHFAYSAVATPYGTGSMPALWVAASVVGVTGTMLCARSRYAWLAASGAALAASPIVYLHYFSLLSVGGSTPQMGRTDE